MSRGGFHIDDVAHLNIRELGQRLAARELSAVELTQRYLQRIDEQNAELNAFITVDPDYSLAQASYDEYTHPGGDLDRDRLAVLADALEEAGANGDVLGHLRSPGPHVKGCFAVDAILGRG